MHRESLGSELESAGLLRENQKVSNRGILKRWRPNASMKFRLEPMKKDNVCKLSGLLGLLAGKFSPEILDQESRDNVVT